MKVKCYYEVRKEVEIEVDDKYSQLVRDFTPTGEKMSNELAQEVYKMLKILERTEDTQIYGIFTSDTSNCLYEE